MALIPLLRWTVEQIAVKEFEIRPDPDDPRLSVAVASIDQNGEAVETTVVTERRLTLFLNAREIVTMMTIGDRPDLLAIGYFLNQNMLKADDEIMAIDYDDDVSTVVVRTKAQTSFEDKLKKKIQTSGCAQGTVFGDLMEEFESVRLNPRAQVKTSWLYQLTKKINTAPSPLSGLERLVFDADPSQADDEDRRYARKSSRAEALE